MKNFPIKIQEDIVVDGENMKGKTVWHSRSCAVAVFVFSNANNEWSVAAVQRGTGCPNNVGKWCCPCGYVDYDETVQVAAARELFEECGLKTGNTTYYDLSINYAGFNDNPREDKLQNITFRFTGLIGYHFKPDLSNINSETDAQITELKKNLADENIYTIGRYGAWTYCSMEDSMIAAKNLAEKLKDN